MLVPHVIWPYKWPKKKPGHDIYKEEDEPAGTVLSNIVEAVGQELELVNKRLVGDKNKT